MAEPLGVFARRDVRGFFTVSVRNPLSRTARDVIRIANQIARQEARPILSLVVAIDNPLAALDRFLPVQYEDTMVANPESLREKIDNAILRDETHEGSDPFINPDGTPSLPDFTRFDVVLGDPGIIRPLRAEDVADALVIHRVNPGNLNPGGRALRGKVKYPQGYNPWVFKAQDNSHDKSLYKDDGKCMDRVCASLGFPLPANADTITPQEFFQYLALLLQEQGKYLQVLDPVNSAFKLKLFEWDWVGEAPPPEYLTVYKPRGRKGRTPKEYHRLVPEDFLAFPSTEVILLYDGDSHIALAELAERPGGKRRLVPNPIYFWGADRIYRFRPSKKAKEEAIPFSWKFGIRTMLHDEWSPICVASPEKVEKERYPPAYLFFDFETVYGRDGMLKPYSVSWMFVEVDPATLQPVGDKTLDEVAQGWKDDPDAARFYYGEDAAFALVEQILLYSYHDYDLPEKPTYGYIVGVTFNGSKFDNFLLYRAFLDYHKHPRADNTQLLDVTREAFWMGTSLVHFQITKSFSIFDLRRHLVGSLDKCCKSFKTINTKISGEIPEHEDIQYAYQTICQYDLDLLAQCRDPMLLPRGKSLDDYPNRLLPPFAETIAKYNKFDVTSLAELFFRYRANNLVRSKKSEDINPPITMASESFSFWQEYVAKKFPKEDGCSVLGLWQPFRMDMYQDIRATSVAGRTQCFHEPMRIEETCVSMDVTSLYPYVMSVAPVYYPYGKQHFYKLGWTPTETRTQFPNIKRLGLFECRVDQSRLFFENRPYILAAKKTKDGDVKMAPSNDWHQPIVEHVWLTTVEVETLLEWNCGVTIQSCWLWEKKVKSIELFGNLADLMAAKNQEDEWKAAGDPRYNPARREGAKLASNALYGKTMEGFHVDKRLPVTPQLYEEIMFDADPMIGRQEKYTYCSAVYPLGDEMVVDVKLNPNHKDMRKKQRPMVVGMYILAYARMYMYKHAYAPLGRDGCLYTDTDAIKCSLSDYNKYLKPYFESTPVPHWPEAEEFDPKYKTAKLVGTKVYGAFENELDGDMEDNLGLYIIAKKVWAAVPSSGLAKDWKCKGKAITMKDIILDEEQLNSLKALKGEPYEFMQRAQDLYRDKTNTVEANPKKFYDSLLYQGKAIILKSDIKKHVTQLRRVEWDGATDPDKVLKNYSCLSQTYRVMELDPRTHQEVVALELSDDELRLELIEQEARDSLGM